VVSGGLRRSASLCPALFQPLPPAVRLDQHTLRISKLLLPLVLKPAKVGVLWSARTPSEPRPAFNKD
jgi:hypothetical protein